MSWVAVLLGGMRGAYVPGDDVSGRVLARLPGRSRSSAGRIAADAAVEAAQTPDDLAHGLLPFLDFRSQSAQVSPGGCPRPLRPDLMVPQGDDALEMARQEQVHHGTGGHAA